MATMIPAVLDPHTRSHGEREVFVRLRDDPETRDWLVLHSLDIAAPRNRIAAEIDFVIAIPGLGVLCLEVKATSHIRRQGGLWFYGSDPEGDPRGPFKQASAAMHELRMLVAKRQPSLASVVFWSGVLLPYLRFPIESGEWHPWQVIDRQGFTAGLARSCRQVLTAARKYLVQHGTVGWFDSAAARPNSAECAELAKILRPEFEIYQSVRARSTEREIELKHYTEEQFVALDAMARNPRVLFEGPAGTGKTLLAMEAGRRAAVQGRRTLFLCFSRLLGAWLASEMRPEATLHVSTLHSYMLKVVGRAVSEAESAQQAFWSHQLPEEATLALLDAGDDQTYDEMVIDEAQDIMFGPYLDFLDLAVNGGLASGRWRMFGDFEKQSIFGSPVPALQDLLQNRAAGSPRFDLRVNCRNVPRIASLCSMLGGLRPPYAGVLRSDDGIEPQIIYHRSESQQMNQLRSAIEGCIRDGFRPQDIVVLSPRAKGSCAEQLCVSGSSLNVRQISEGRRTTVCYTTVHAFKGLESPCAIVTDIEHVSTDSARAIFYTAITRGTDRVAVLADERCREDVVRCLTETPMEELQ